MEAFLIALPGFLFSSISALPLALGTLAAGRHLRAGTRLAYLRNLNGSIAAGGVALLLLWGSLFGDDLSSSSTAALIFLFVPIYAAAAQGIVYCITTVAVRNSAPTEDLSPTTRRAFLLPLAMLGILMFGLITNSMGSNDMTVAERSSDPTTLRGLFDDSRSGKADPFSVPLFLTQNPNTPTDILVELAKHGHPAIRAQVVQHVNTPEQVVEGMRNDCAGVIRRLVEERLGPNKALQARTRLPTCARLSASVSRRG